MSGQYGSLQKGKARQRAITTTKIILFLLHPTVHKYFEKKIIGLILRAIETLFNPRTIKQGGNENYFLLMISHCFHFTQ